MLGGPGPHERRLKGYPEEPRTLGAHLRRRRIGLRMTQVQAAREFGVCDLPYIKWEADRTRPGIANWPAIVRFLGFDPIPAPTDFSEATGALMRDLGADRRRLAVMLDVDVKSVFNWERSTSIPCQRMRSRLAALATDDEARNILLGGKR